jgi:hypothetical protein
VALAHYGHTLARTMPQRQQFFLTFFAPVVKCVEVAKKDAKGFRVTTALAKRLEALAHLMRRSANQTLELILQDVLDFLDEPHSKRTTIRFIVEADSARLARGTSDLQEEISYVLNDLPKAKVHKREISPKSGNATT